LRWVAPFIMGGKYSIKRFTRWDNKLNRKKSNPPVIILLTIENLIHPLVDRRFNLRSLFIFLVVVSDKC